jgi:hypothetical protein
VLASIQHLLFPFLHSGAAGRNDFPIAMTVHLRIVADLLACGQCLIIIRRLGESGGLSESGVYMPLGEMCAQLFQYSVAACSSCRCYRHVRSGGRDGKHASKHMDRHEEYRRTVSSQRLRRPDSAQYSVLLGRCLCLTLTQVPLCHDPTSFECTIRTVSPVQCSVRFVASRCLKPAL